MLTKIKTWKDEHEELIDDITAWAVFGLVVLISWKAGFNRGVTKTYNTLLEIAKKED